MNAVSVAEPDIARPALNGTGPGELSYITYEVPDPAAAREFYGRVLHWSFEPGRIDDGWGVVGCHPMAGIAGGAQRPGDSADVDGRRHRGRGGPGPADPQRQSYGLMAECTDDQGARFYLGQF